MQMQRFTKKQFDQMFPDDDACLEWLKNYIYPDGIYCKTCGEITKHYRVKNRKSYSCATCGHHVHPTARTIYHKSSTSLRDWFYAVFLMANTRMGISAKQLERELGVTYKTAWRMFKKIREMMQDGHLSLSGHIEIDETYIGGKRKGKRGRGAAGKTIAVGMVQRGNKAIVKISPSVKSKDLMPLVKKHIPLSKDTMIFTDELPSYSNLTKIGFSHQAVQHSAKQYVDGNAHVNNVEGLWSIVKNGITGVNRQVSSQHLQSYLDAYVFRYNHRSDDEPMFMTLLGQVEKV